MAVASALALAGCGSGGGGAGGGGASGGPVPATGTVNVSITDGPTTDFDHVWVTISELRFHTSNVVGANDAGWVTFPLVAPVTVDLASLSNGALAKFFSNLALPVGTYRQIRVLLVDAADTLADSALAQGLTYNAQVDWTDTQGNSHSSPLEIASPQQGIAVTGTFTLGASAPLNLVLDFDVGHDVVAFNHAGARAFVLKPLLRAYDQAQSGAVAGRVDTTNLCPSPPAQGCAFDLVIKAESLLPSGAYHAATRYTTVRLDGSFVLYPVAVPAGQQTTTIDVLVRGRNMETLLVRSVPVTAGTSPTSNPTSVAVTNLPVTLGAEYTANAATAVSPTGAWVSFYQTLPGQGEVPYEVRFRHVDPFTGLFFEDIALSTGPLHVANWAAAGAPTFISNAPVQGNGGFLVFADALGYARGESASDPLVAPGGAGPALFTSPALAVNPLFNADSISGAIQQSTPNQYDRGELVVTWMGTIVTTLPLDTVLAANSGTGGTYTVANLPGGTAVNPMLAGLYGLYARVWNSGNPLSTLKRIEFNGIADLRMGNAAGVNLTLN
jgi:hypothetical protein